MLEKLYFMFFILLEWWVLSTKQLIFRRTVQQTRNYLLVAHKMTCTFAVLAYCIQTQGTTST